ncbi:hypothetical protein NtRootA9_17650 [Arthrobacter sp. NtRootA9]|nr:hypothetical protein NtRootA9_17650 [Arthrobacter sp. NtRootA9]
MSGIVDGILNVRPALAYTLVALLVFAEDALFIGFVIPGETAAVLGGVVASRGQAELVIMMALVVVSAVAGDTVGYEVGRRAGPGLLENRHLLRHRDKLDRARDFLRRRGGWAVFLGRFVALFRALVPALAGASRMHYPTFLAFNAAGGLLWGTGFVLLGYLAGNSYGTVAKVVGGDVTAAVVVGGLVALAVWRFRRARGGKRGAPDGRAGG